MRRNLNARVPQAQGAFVRERPQWEYSPFMGNSSHLLGLFQEIVFSK